jgi:hypothetical protein
MPLVDFNDPSLWDGGPASLYRDAEGRGFVRETRGSYYGDSGQDAVWLREALGIEPGDSIIIVGGAFGWIAELWDAQGYGPIVVTDTSQWIQDNKAENAVVPILDEDGKTAESRDRILATLGVDLATWVISEDVLPALLDDEAVEMSQGMRLLGENVAHWVSAKLVTQDDRLNWKTLEDWKELVAPDLVVGRNDPRVL